MVQDKISYPQAMPNFWLCIPSSIPIFQMKIHHRRPSNSFRKRHIPQAQKASLSNSKSVIQMGFIKCSYLFIQEHHTVPQEF